jgi:hypothetical protein
MQMANTWHAIARDFHLWCSLQAETMCGLRTKTRSEGRQQNSSSFAVFLTHQTTYRHPNRCHCFGTNDLAPERLVWMVLAVQRGIRWPTHSSKPRLQCRVRSTQKGVCSDTDRSLLQMLRATERAASSLPDHSP